MNWQPIEIAPKDRLILGYDALYGIYIVSWYRKAAGWYDLGSNRYHPTHWQLLPERPK